MRKNTSTRKTTESHMEGTFQALMNAHVNATSKTSAISELLDNALTYAQNIWIHYDDMRHVLTVTNDGIPFKKTDLRQVFSKATYNGDKSPHSISKYGVGIKAAVAALVNPTNDSECYIVASNGQQAWGEIWTIRKHFNEESSVFVNDWDQNLLPHDVTFVGTTIYITNCYLSPEDLARFNGLIERNFSLRIQRGVNIFFNGEKINPFDTMYLTDLGESINRSGRNVFWRNNKAYLVDNFEAVNKNDKDDVIDLRLVCLYIPEALFNLADRNAYLDSRDKNAQEFGGPAVSYIERYLMVNNGNISLLGHKNNRAAAGRKRMAICLNRRSANIFHVNHTKNNGIDHIPTNDELRNYMVKGPNGRKMNLQFYITEMWKWLDRAYKFFETNKRDLNTVNDENLYIGTISMIRPVTRSRTLPTLPSSIDLSVIAEDSILSVTTSHLREVLEAYGIPTHTVLNVIEDLTNV